MFQDNTHQSENSKTEYRTLSSVVFSVQADLGEGPERFAQYLNYAQDYYRELTQTSLRELKVAELKMTEWKEISFPKDMIDWTKIGVRCGDMVKTFTYDSNIPLIKDREGGLKQKFVKCKHIYDLEYDNKVYYGIYPYYNDSGLGYNYKFFGRAVLSNGLGYFNVDKERRVIIFRDTIDKDQTIYIEYIGDGINPSASTIIRSNTLFNLLKAKVLYKRSLHSNEPINQKLLYKEELYQAERIFDLSELDLSLEDIREAIREGYSLLPQT